MQKDRDRQWGRWLFLSLCGSLLLAAFFLTWGRLLQIGGPSSVMAASREEEQKQSECSNRQQSPSFGGTIVVDTSELVCGNLTSFGGTLVINGEVRGNIVAFGSTIDIIGTVHGNINLYGGTLTLQSSSHVQGEISLYGSRYTRGANSTLQGEIVDHSAGGGLPFFMNGSFGFPFWPLFIWVALGLLITSLLPEHLLFVRTTVVHKTRRSLLIGLLSMLLAPLILVVSIALILPIPVAIIVVLGLLAAWALGNVAVGWIVGEAILQRIAPRQSTRLLQTVVGLTAVVLVGSLPYIGWLITIGSGLLGVGAVLLSRFGTRLYGSPKKPLPF